MENAKIIFKFTVKSAIWKQNQSKSQCFITSNKILSQSLNKFNITCSKKLETLKNLLEKLSGKPKIVKEIGIMINDGCKGYPIILNMIKCPIETNALSLSE